MPFVPSSSLSEAEVERYMRVFHATVNVLANAVVIYDQASKSRTDANERDRFRLEALNANRELQLITSKLTAFLQGEASVRAPTDAEVQNAQTLAQKLADLAVAQSKFSALVKVTGEAVDAFAKINASAAAPAVA